MSERTWLQLILVGGPILGLIGSWLALRGYQARRRIDKANDEQ